MIKNLISIALIVTLCGLLTVSSKGQPHCIPLKEPGLINYNINGMCGANGYCNFNLISPLEANKESNLLIVDEINKIISASSYRRELLSNGYDHPPEKERDKFQNMKFKIDWEILKKNAEIFLDSFCLSATINNKIFYYSSCLISSQFIKSTEGDIPDEKYFLNIDLADKKMLDLNKDVLNKDSISIFHLWVQAFCKKNKINNVPVGADEPLNFKHKIEYLKGLNNDFYLLKDSLIIFNKVKILDLNEHSSFDSSELENGNEYYMEVSIPINHIKSFLNRSFIDKFYIL